MLSIDPDTQGVLCMEEPENGIHPERIPAMIRLLEDLALDPMRANGSMRQVIINTHSPAIVLQVPSDSLVMAVSVDQRHDNQLFRALELRGLQDTWRTKNNSPAMTMGQLLAYLNPVALPGPGDRADWPIDRPIDRDDIRQLCFPFQEKAS